MHGIELHHAPEPGSPAWLKLMTASKIAAVVGLSRYESRFSLWHKMAGLLPPEPQTSEQSRGHYLEPAICHWFADQHPELTVNAGGTWVHPERPWQAASPDRVTPDAVVEAKSAADDTEWGPAGSDELPPGYRAQVMWQMDTLGVKRAHIAVLLPYLEFREYVIDYDPAEAEWLVTSAQAFMDSLPDGANPQRPNLDAHTETYEAVRKLHPSIDRRDVEIPAALWLEYESSKAAADVAAAAHRHAKTAVLDAMGTARIALVNDQPVLRRQPGRGDSVSLYTVTRKADAA